MIEFDDERENLRSFISNFGIGQIFQRIITIKRNILHIFLQYVQINQIA